MKDEPYLSDPDVTLYQGDALDVLRQLPDRLRAAGAAELAGGGGVSDYFHDPGLVLLCAARYALARPHSYISRALQCEVERARWWLTQEQVDQLSAEIARSDLSPAERDAWHQALGVAWKEAW